MRFNLLILQMLLFSGCDSRTVESNAYIKPLVGNWTLTEIQIIDGYNKTWQPLPFDKKNNITIRYDGVILDYKQEGVCCRPSSLNISGSIVLINKALEVMDNTDCASACIQCQVWTIALAGDEMIITGCVPTDVKKYKRL